MCQGRLVKIEAHVQLVAQKQSENQRKENEYSAALQNWERGNNNLMLFEIGLKILGGLLAFGLIYTGHWFYFIVYLIVYWFLLWLNFPRMAPPVKPQKEPIQLFYDVISGEIINEDASNGTPPAAQTKRPGWINQQMQKLNPFNTAGKQAAKGAAKVTKYSKPYIDKWNQYVGANPALQNNSQALQKYAATLAVDRSNQPMFTPEMPTDMSTSGVSRYISDVVAKVLSESIIRGNS